MRNREQQKPKFVKVTEEEVNYEVAVVNPIGLIVGVEIYNCEESYIETQKTVSAYNKKQEKYEVDLLKHSKKHQKAIEDNGGRLTDAVRDKLKAELDKIKVPEKPVIDKSCITFTQVEIELPEEIRDLITQAVKEKLQQL